MNKIFRVDEANVSEMSYGHTVQLDRMDVFNAIARVAPFSLHLSRLFYSRVKQ